MSLIQTRKIVFETPWIRVVAKTLVGESQEDPYYSLALNDYVSVVGYDAQGRIALIRQFRPAVEQETLEIPAGLVDPGESPESAAQREFWEETGFRPTTLEPLCGPMFPDTGRLGNRIYYYMARLVEPDLKSYVPEKGIEVLWLSAQELTEAIDQGRFAHAIHVTGVLLAERQRSKRG